MVTFEEDEIPHALLCFKIANVVRLNSDINLIPASISSKLLYESSLPFNFSKMSPMSPLKTADWCGFSPYLNFL